MHRYLLALLFSLVLAVSAWSQDTESEGAETEETPVEAEQEDDSDLDEQVYTDADDDFRPSEQIPADESIAFPTDI